MQPFSSYDDQVRYLDQAICMYEGKPVLVNSRTDDPGVVKIEYLCQANLPKYINIVDNAFDTFPFELGYYNSGDACCFLSQSGVRRSVYGLHLSKVSHSWNSDAAKTLVSPRTLAFSKGFVACLNNKYPSLKEAIELVENGVARSRAFHKHYCVDTFSEELIVIHALGDKNPFAVYDRETKEFSPFLGLSKNKAKFYIANKSGVLKLS